MFLFIDFIIHKSISKTNTLKITYIQNDTDSTVVNSLFILSFIETEFASLKIYTLFKNALDLSNIAFDFSAEAAGITSVTL